jgi:hypothetical protein
MGFSIGRNSGSPLGPGSGAQSIVQLLEIKELMGGAGAWPGEPSESS